MFPVLFCSCFPSLTQMRSKSTRKRKRWQVCSGCSGSLLDRRTRGAARRVAPCTEKAWITHHTEPGSCAELNFECEIAKTFRQHFPTSHTSFPRLRHYSSSTTVSAILALRPQIIFERPHFTFARPHFTCKLFEATNL